MKLEIEKGKEKKEEKQQFQLLKTEILLQHETIA